MKTSAGRILTTHVGSLPRPASLLPMLIDLNDGKDVDQAQYRELLAGCVSEAAQTQCKIGLDIVNDGEFSRIAYASHIGARLAGFEVDEEIPARGVTHPGETADFPEFFARPYTHGPEGLRKWRCVGPIEWRDFASLERDIENLKQAIVGLGPTEVFMTSPVPTLAASRQPNGGYYRTEEEFVYALADVLKREYRAIVDAGFVLQLDMPFTGARGLPGPVAEVLPRIRKLLERNIEILNYAVADIPSHRMRFHVCHGSDESPHTRDPELAQVVDILMRARPAGLTLVAASPRHEHEWQVWKERKLPEGKVLIPGFIDHTTNIVEHPHAVADRIIRYASVVGPESLIAGVDCGFSPSAGMDTERVDPRVMSAKFASLVEGARIASAEIWP